MDLRIYQRTYIKTRDRARNFGGFMTRSLQARPFAIHAYSSVERDALITRRTGFMKRSRSDIVIRCGID
jgi:hypothetical protein